MFCCVSEGVKIYLIRHGRAAAGWGESDDPEIDPRFSEIPTPEHIPHNRKAWIKDILSKRWDALDIDLQAWRETLLTALCSLKQDTIVFTHFIAINAIAGKAMHDHRVLVFLPDNTSITSVKIEGLAITLLEKGAEMTTAVG